MTDTEMPPDEPYEVGDRVRVRLTDEDAESPFEGTICRVAHVFVDGTGQNVEPEANPEAERELADAAYRLEDTESGDVLPVVLRHRDLHPVDEEG